MYELDKILENIRANEEIARKLFEIEVSILSTCDFKDLFEKLLLLIEEKLGIPHVWISIISESDVSHLIAILEQSHIVKDRLNFIEKTPFLQLLENKETPRLVNENLMPFYKLLPENQKYLVKSLAVTPLFFDNNIIGSLNLGDFSGLRFQPEMDTFFLSQLAVKISICLSNVTAREKLKHLAISDPLTSLLNRREMENMLEREYCRYDRYENHFAVIFIDLDDFKVVNDTYGHDSGDLLLQYVAKGMTKMIRKNDVAFRFAGDEFVIILPNQTSKEALHVSERLCTFFDKNPLRLKNKTIPFSISCGVASTEDPQIESSSDILKYADERLYEAKKQKNL